MMAEYLFSPFPVLGLKNRIVMPPMTRHTTYGEGLPTEELADYYLRRAEGGVGLVIVESAAIGRPASFSYVGGLQFHSPTHVAAWKPIVDRIHAAGAKVWIQIYHGGRLITPELIGGHQPLAPSPIPPFETESRFMVKRGEGLVHFQTGTPFPVPRQMSPGDIQMVQDAFARSCRLAMEAGFDGVELHGAHGYLLHQFSSTQTNTREDEYGPGGDLCRFARETARLCREQIPSGRVLAYRLSLHRVDLIFIRYQKNEMDFSELVRSLEEDVDVFHSSELRAGLPMFGSKLSLSEEVRSATKKPIITCGEVKTRTRAEEVLASGNTDLVAFGRALIANPELPEMLRSGDMSRYIEFDHDVHMAGLI
jgi:2,4-dienoyl-CoA reductase-like NADH-dependent reductase (Old Yellow Enzyme family)